jgi:hypothetical protein
VLAASIIRAIKMEAARTSETLVNFYQTTDRSRAEKLWLVCGVMGDVMLSDRERDMYRSQKNLCYYPF